MSRASTKTRKLFQVFLIVRCSHCAYLFFALHIHSSLYLVVRFFFPIHSTIRAKYVHQAFEIFHSTKILNTKNAKFPSYFRHSPIYMQLDERRGWRVDQAVRINREEEEEVETSCAQVFTIFHAVLFSTVRIISLHQFYAFKRFTVAI